MRTLLDDPELRAILNLRSGQSGLERIIDHPRIQKNGLILAGYLQGTNPSRIQILGETELSFLETMTRETRRQSLEVLFAAPLSCLIVTRGVDPPADVVEFAQSAGTPLVVAQPRSSQTIHALHLALDRLLAPQITLHGVLVIVHGLGVLLMGPSGIGKSECALFLVERGHRLVADDRVILTLVPTKTILGKPEPLLRHYLELRGVGVINIRDLFGATAVCDEAQVDLVVDLQAWDDDSVNRLGLDDQEYMILGQGLPKFCIPVRPGRDMAVILEVAARNHLLRLTGEHAGRALTARIEEVMGLGRRNASQPL